MTYSVESSEVAYDGVMSTVVMDRVRMPDGSVAQREVVRQSDAVGVVALQGEDVVLLEQYRHPLGRRMLEIPAGKLDVEGESPEAAARRELLEEVGLEATTFQPLVSFANSAGWTDETTTVYLARDATAAARPENFTAEHEEADMRIVRMPLSEAVTRAERGEITDAKTLVGLLLVDRRLRHP
jgi:8-oxo-dGDP phosphatase